MDENKDIINRRRDVKWTQAQWCSETNIIIKINGQLLGNKGTNKFWKSIKFYKRVFKQQLFKYI